MRCLWILAAVAVLLILLCMTRLGVLVAFGEQFTVDIKFGVFRFRAVPAQKPKREKAEKKAGKKTAKKGAEKAEKPSAKFQKPTLEDIRSAWQTLWPPLRRTMRRIGRGIRISPLEISVVFGGGLDPAAAAEHYGKAQGLIWAIMPALEQMADVRSPAIHIGLDFEADQITAQGRAGISLRVGTLLACGFGMGVPALRWLLKNKSQHRQKELDEKNKQPSDTAA